MIDIERLLRRVVSDVFDGTVEATYFSDPKDRHAYRVHLRAPYDGGRRNAVLRASYCVFSTRIVDLGVCATNIDEDHDESEKAAALRELAVLTRAYLTGEGRVEERRRLLRTHTVLTLTVDGREWELSRRWSKHPTP